MGKKLDSNDELLTVRQVQEILCYSDETIYRYIKSGKLRAVRVGSKIWRIPRSWLNEFLKEGIKE